MARPQPVFLIRTSRRGVVRGHFAGAERVTSCSFTAMSSQCHRKHTSMRKKRGLGWLGATADGTKRASCQQGTKCNGERRAIASHREAQGFAQVIASQPEVHSWSTIDKL